MVLRKSIFGMALLGSVAFVGCGSGITDENVPEKVITAEDMDRARQQMASLSSPGDPTLHSPPERKAAKHSSSGK